MSPYPDRSVWAPGYLARSRAGPGSRPGGRGGKGRLGLDHSERRAESGAAWGPGVLAGGCPAETKG